MSEHVAQLQIADGSELVTFDELDCTIDMLAPGAPWTVTLWYSEGTANALAAWKSVKRRALVEETVTLSIDGSVQLRGRIEKATTRTTREGKTLTISGRDLAARAMDWDCDPRLSLRGRTLEDALREIFVDVGITPVVIEGARQAEVQGRPQRARSTRTASATATSRTTHRRSVIDAFKINQGDKIWAVADQLCRRLGYMMWCAPASEDRQSAIVVDVPVSSGETLYTFDRRQVSKGVYGGNILESTYALDGADVPTLVTAFCDAPCDSNDDAHGRWVVVNTRYREHPQVAHRDLAGLLPKPRYIKPKRTRTIADIEKAADRCIAEAMADFETYELTVRGWGQGGRTYAANTLARLRDDSELPALDAPWLITRVSFKRSREGGTTSTLRLVPAGAIRVFPAEAA